MVHRQIKANLFKKNCDCNRSNEFDETILADRQSPVISSDTHFNAVISNKSEQRHTTVVLINKYFLNNNNGILNFVVG